jgi:hypothetical protein
MAYQAQLVVRTRDPKGVRVIEKVKRLAELESKTFSEKALEILERGLGDLGPEEEEAGEPSEEEEEEEDDESESASADDTIRREPTTPTPPPDIPEKSPDVRPDESPDVVAKKCIESFETGGADKAAQTLAVFFAVAEPVDGAAVREELQDRLSASDYEEIMEELMQTDEYRAYRKRVVYASW